MSGYGPLRDAPNPIQRSFARSALAGAAFFGVVIGAFATLPLLLAGAALRTIVLCALGGFTVGTATMWVSGRRLTAEERGDNVVRYLPWFGRQGEPPAGIAAPEPIRPFTRMLARATMVRSVLRGAVLGAAATAPWVSRLWIAGVASAVGGVLGGLAHRRYRRPPRPVQESKR